MTTEDANTSAASSPLEREVRPLVERLQDEADLCRNDGATDIAALLDEAACALSYYRAGLDKGGAPAYVPMAIWLPNTVRGDPPIGHKAVAPAGHHECNSNRWGAVSVNTPHGALGIKPSEFHVTRWRRNEA